MNILQANKFFSIKGGSDTVFFDTIAGLRKRGHLVAEFSMDAPNNAPSAYRDYFVRYANLRTATTPAEKWKVFKRFFVSKEVDYKLSELVKATHPDVAHLHNVYHELSASTFTTLRKLHVPTVMTVHDFFPLCANHNLLIGDTMAEDKLANKPWNCFRYSAVNGSKLQSFAGMLEMYYYQYKHIWDEIDAFICPSEFTRDTLAKHGFPVHKLHVVPYPISIPTTPTAKLGTDILFFGRLHVEKGTRILLQALTRLPKYNVQIVGSGPDEAYMKKYIADHNLTNVTMTPWIDRKDMGALIAKARVMVVPSIFYETGGISAMEAMLYGRLVVGTKRGALPETVQDTVTGLLARPEDSADLARTLDKAMQLTVAEADAMIVAGRKLIATRNNPDTYIQSLEKIYTSVITK